MIDEYKPKNSKVIEFDFKRGRSNEHEVAHPASKRFPETLDYDPLDEIMASYDELEPSFSSSDDLYETSYDLSAQSEDILETISSQILKAKEYSMRLKYYLNEIKDS